MERKWSVRDYREGDEEGIFELWKAVYPERKYDRDRWMRWWHWLYKENPAGAGWMSLADHEGRIVGQQAAVPMVMNIGAEVATCFQSIDAMNHPAYRGQGVYKAVNMALFSRTAEDGVPIGYSFANEASHPIAVTRVPYFDVSRISNTVKPFNWGNTLKMGISNKFLLKSLAVGGNIAGKTFCRTKRAPVVEGLTISQVSRFDERINEFWDSVSSQYAIMVVRNKDYLNWRYVAVPDIDYTIYIAEKEGEINGYLVLRCMEMEQATAGVIFDILVQSEEIAQWLLSKATEHCKQEAVDLIYGSMLANKTLLKAFKRNGFISMPFVKGGWFVAHSSSQGISKEFLMDAKNWFVQIGDSDML